MKVDVYVPIQIHRDNKIRTQAIELLENEWERLWPETVSGGDPTFIMHGAEDSVNPYVSYWADESKDDMISEFWRGVCFTLMEVADVE